MSFVSWSFVALFLVVLAGRLTIGRRKIEPAFVALLIVASALFYAWHIPQYIVILLFSAAIDFVAGLRLGRLPREAVHARRGWLVASLLTNLGLLGFFKYGDFVLRAVGDLMGLAGAPVTPPELGLILPMGISFYTFQSLSYTIDVYRGVLAPIADFPRFFLYISFFPQLVAGPIVRAADFLPQLPRPRRLRLVTFYEGSWLILRGFFLKMVCADNLAIYVNEHWARGYQPQTNAAFALWLALMFSGQIFADFAGYSSIARGLGYLLGFRLPVNFNAPYVAASLKNFWERWHITLSQWLRDYLYLPLGGNRVSRRRTYVNLLLVMLLGGLWHGAAYTFIVWGAIHGSALAVERLLGLHREGATGRAGRLAWFVVVQAVVLVAWVFFRSESFGGALQFVGNLFAFDFGALPSWALLGSLFLVPLVMLHAWTWAVEQGVVRPLSPPARAALAAGMAYAVMTLYAGTSEFIYFQF
ncbi:MAG: MBOAT family protein [Vicinamibacterales bacterium]